MSKVESSSRALYCAAFIGMLLVVSAESYAQNYQSNAQNWARVEREARIKLQKAEEIVRTYPQDSSTYREAVRSLPLLKHGVEFAMENHTQELRSRPRVTTYSKPQSSGYANYGANGYDYDEGLGRPTTSSRMAPAATASTATAPVYPVDDGIHNAAPLPVQHSTGKAVGMLRVSVSSLSDDYILHIFPRPENMKANRDLLWRELSRLENVLSDNDLTDEARAKAVSAFKERNMTWYGRYEQAVAARELVMARNGLVTRPEGSRLKHLSAKEALALVSTSDSADKNLKRGLDLALKKSAGGSFFKKVGFLTGRAQGAGLVGVVGAVAGAAVSGAVVAGEAESLVAEDETPVTFLRSEFRPEARRRISK